MGYIDVLIAWNASYTNAVDNNEQSIPLKFELHDSSLNEDLSVSLQLHK